MALAVDLRTSVISIARDDTMHVQARRLVVNFWGRHGDTRDVNSTTKLYLIPFSRPFRIAMQFPFAHRSGVHTAQLGLGCFTSSCRSSIMLDASAFGLFAPPIIVAEPRLSNTIMPTDTPRPDLGGSIIVAAHHDASTFRIARHSSRESVSTDCRKHDDICRMLQEGIREIRSSIAAYLIILTTQSQLVLLPEVLS